MSCNKNSWKDSIKGYSPSESNPISLFDSLKLEDVTLINLKGEEFSTSLYYDLNSESSCIDLLSVELEGFNSKNFDPEKANLRVSFKTIAAGDNITIEEEDGCLTLSASTIEVNSIKDIIGEMVVNNIESLIDVTYSNGKLNFEVTDDLSLFDNSSSNFLTNVEWADIGGALVLTPSGGNILGSINVADGTFTLNTPAASGEANTASNEGSSGVGVFDNKLIWNLEFRNLNSISSAIDISLDAPNKKIDFDLIESNIDHDGLSNYVANEHIDWTQYQGGTLIHPDNYAVFGLSQEEVQDYAWNVLSGSQSLISVVYADGTNQVHFTVEPDLSNYNNDLNWTDYDTSDFNTDFNTKDTDDLPEGVTNLYFPGFTDLNTDYGFTDNSSNWNTAYDNHIVNISVSGTTTKTITLTQQDGGTITANFTDMSGAGGDGNDYLDNGSFNTSNGELTLEVLNQSDVVIDLDGRYALLSHTHTWGDVTGTPTTLSGYGITDAYTQTELQTSGSSSVHWDNLTNVPTYDNYDYWTIGSDSGFGNINSNNAVSFIGGSNISTSFNDITKELTISATTLSNEEVEDIVGAMVSSNTENLITVTYDDPAGKLNFSVEPDLSNYNNDAGFLTSIPASYLENTDIDTLAELNSIVADATIASQAWVTAQGYITTDDNDIDYISNVSLVGTDLTFTGVGNAFSSTVDLSSLLDNTNNYANSLSFNDTNGILTLGRLGLSDLTVDLDGRYLTSFSEVNDLTAAVVWDDVPDANITESSVTQHESALTITESQISDLGNYAVVGHTHTASNITDFDTEVSNNTSVAANTAKVSFPGFSSLAADYGVTLATVATTGDYSDLSGTPSIPVVDDTVYGVSWNGNTDGATKNAIYDKIESLPGGHSPVTLAGSLNYLSLSSQEITLLAIDLATDVTGVLPSGNIGSHSHVIADITDFTDNSTNWNTAFGWGDHDGLYVGLTGNESIAGIKTFTSFSITPSSAPSTDYQVANKKYVDDEILSAGYISNVAWDEIIGDQADINISGFTNDAGFTDYSSSDFNTDFSSKDSDDLSEGVTNLYMTSAEKSKLTGIASGAEVNVNADWNSGSGDSEILNKPTIPTLLDEDDMSSDSSSDGATQQSIKAYVDNKVNRVFDRSLLSDHEVQGDVAILTNGQGSAVTFGQVGHLNTSGEFILGDADGGPDLPIYYIVAENSIANSSSGQFLMFGLIRDDSWNWTVPGVVYLSTTAGTLTQTAPTSDDDIITRVGWAETADIIMFKPSIDTHTYGT